MILGCHFQVKVGDFGLLQHADGADGVGGDAKVQGTMGYMDPEYFQTNVATTKSDVYR